MATATTQAPTRRSLRLPKKETLSMPINNPVEVANTSSVPFDIETTLSFEAIEHWAKVDPHRTALISSDTQWKVDSLGKLAEKHSITNPREWTVVTYAEFWSQVNRMRAALHEAGVPLPHPNKPPCRVLLLWAPPSRANVLALIMALQAAGCVLLFGTPEAFGGIRNFLEVMMGLNPDAVIANKLVYGIFRAIALTLHSKKRPALWIKSTVLTKLAVKLTDEEVVKYNRLKSGVTLDSITAVMFSSGSTGPPTPIEISQRMLGFQAAGYAQMLQKHLGAGVIREHTTITGVIGEDCVLTSKRDGPWITTHIFVNFAMLDLVLGGTAVMQPMGVNCPDKTVCAETLLDIYDHFQPNVTSAPPALWKRMLKLKREKQGKSGMEGLQMAFIGGAETSASFAMDLAKHFFEEPNSELQGCGLYRVYGTTQVLPIALASDIDIRNEEMAKKLCARGYGVCLGIKVEGVDVAIDTEVWERKGGRSQLKHYEGHQQPPLEVGELCALGKAVSPSMEVVAQPESPRRSKPETPTRIFRSGDVCYVDPKTNYIYFLGRIAHSVDCGDELKLVPPAGVEMICLESKVVDKCAFVGVPHSKTGAISPTLVVQFQDNERKPDVEAACKSIRRALEHSVWAGLLKTNLSLIVYSDKKSWPVDARHSSKTDRFHLRDWAAKADGHKFHRV